jgi:hypothetical protein
VLSIDHVGNADLRSARAAAEFPSHRLKHLSDAALLAGLPVSLRDVAATVTSNAAASEISMRGWARRPTPGSCSTRPGWFVPTPRLLCASWVPEPVEADEPLGAPGPVERPRRWSTARPRRRS